MVSDLACAFELAYDLKPQSDELLLMVDQDDAHLLCVELNPIFLR
jgi:hypothetical protein